MSWVSQHGRLWRVIGLALLALALPSPWFFDVINVPAEFACSAPFVRLDGDFCGQPMSILYFIFSIFGGYFQMITGWTAGTADLSLPGVVESIYILVMLMIYLPLLTNLNLLLRGEHRRWQIFSLVVLILAGGYSLVIALNSHPRLFWHVWGVWLYVAVAAVLVTFEIGLLFSSTGKRYNPINQQAD